MECACERGLADPEGESRFEYFRTEQEDKSNRTLPSLWIIHDELAEWMRTRTSVGCCGRLGVKAHESENEDGKKILLTSLREF